MSLKYTHISMLRGFLICFAQQKRNKIGAQRRHIAFFALFDLYFPTQNLEKIVDNISVVVMAPVMDER